MTPDDAKFLLRARRPGGADDADPAMAEALAMAHADPTLRAWAAKEQAADAVIAAKLRAVPVPADLRQAILAGGRLSRPRAWWRQPAWLGLAAALVLGIGLAAVVSRVRPAPDALALLAEAALVDLAEGAHVRGGTTHAHDLGAVGRWLEDPATRLTQAGPLDLATLRAEHCRTLRVGGKEVFEICFLRGQFFHVYVGRREDFPVLPDHTRPLMRTVRGHALAAWSDARHVYLVAASDADQAALQQIL